MTVDEPDLTFSEVPTLEEARRRRDAPALIEFTAQDTGGVDTDSAVTGSGIRPIRSRVTVRRRSRP